MISGERILELSNEACRVRKKYNPQTIGDLERIAVEEYGVVRVVKTPFARPSRVVEERETGAAYIFYHASYEPYLLATLGHEIGHIAASHEIEAGINFDEREKMEYEANYFSAQLIGLPLDTLHRYRDVSAILSVVEDCTNLFRRKKMKKEITRLQQLGVYDLLLYGGN